MRVCLRFSLIVAPLVGLAVMADARGQEAPGRVPRFRESVALDTDSTVAKRLATVEEYRAAGEWDEAVEALVEVMAANGDALVPVTPGRYIRASLYGNLLASSFPPEGLAAYRKRVDVQTRQWFDAAREARGDGPLEDIVRRAFASSVGDDALWLLGERAFEQGRFAAARHAWTRLVPRSLVPAEGAPARLEATLQYPDSDFALPDVLARLILCSLFEGDFERAEQELADFRTRFPEATGALAGREGNLGEILAEVAREAATWTFPAEHRSASTFARNFERNGAAPPAPEFSGQHWQRPLPPVDLELPLIKAAFPGDEPLSRFPVVFGDVVLLNDAHRIMAWNLRNGQPAWAGGGSESAVIYPTVPELPAQPPERLLGVPRFTMTVHDGRLYARLGSPVTGQARNELRDLTTELVCLDLAQGEGRLVWKATAGEVLDGGNWAFEGSPVVSGNRVWVAMRRSHPQTQINITCLDSETGDRIWSRKVCTAVTEAGDSQNIISHQLLTLAGDTLFLSTDLGAIAAVDARDGGLRWVFTYESRRTESPAVLSDHLQQGLTPCLFDRGLVITAPNDFDGIIALDASNGVRRWHQTLKGGVRHLLGVVDGTLVVSGNRLAGIEARTGRRLWTIDAAGPESAGYGRGAIAGDRVYWPKREEIWIVKATGDKAGQAVPGSPLRKPGGNLVVAGDHLLIARPDEIVALWEFGDFREPGLREISANPPMPSPTPDRSDDPPPAREQAMGPELPWRRLWERQLDAAAVPLVPVSVLAPVEEMAGDDLLLLQNERLEAVRSSNGATVWSTAIESPVRWAGKTSAAVIAATDRDLRAFAAGTGEILWTREFAVAEAAHRGEEFPARPRFTAISGRIVRFDPDGTLEAIDARSGARLWTATDLDGPLVEEWGCDSRTILLQTARGGRVVAVDVETGAIRPRLNARRTRWQSAPVFLGDAVVVTGAAAQVFSLPQNDRASGWEYRGAISAANVPPRLLTDGTHLVLLIDGDTAAGLDPNSGESRWNVRFAREPAVHPGKSVALAGGRLYAAGDGVLRGVSLDGGELMWAAPLGDRERDWRVKVCGTAVAAWTGAKGSGDPGMLVLCEAETGRRIQDFTAPNLRGPLELHLGGEAAVLVSPDQLVGFGPFASRDIRTARRLPGAD